MTTLPTPRRTLRRHRLARTSTWGAALLLALTACGGDSPGPAASSSVSSASTASGPATASASEASNSTASAAETTASESADAGAYVPASEKGPARNVPKPVMPEAVKEDTQEGAEAAVQYWWDAVYYLQQTNDPEPLKAVSSNDCNLCAAYPKTIERAYSSGGWLSGTKPEITSLLSQDLGGHHAATLLITMEPGMAYLEDGSIDRGTESLKRENQPWAAIIQFDESSSQWLVEEMSYEGSEE
ncbi:DUF6318 family protein [Micrococcus sp.]|uniref:DUF6318 family protein n=1 Tax=Micrococcus sp. TaxID=1271 RepID=UPI0026DD7810|nr:DUF6318 family protein [Micrococcus sp.]MDO4240810.1 DUF6318 family protein [Micrococcus sp.]